MGSEWVGNGGDTAGESMVPRRVRPEAALPAGVELLR